VAGRIVSLVPAVTEMLFAIGAGPQVVGVSSFDQYPPEVATRTRVGALLDPDLEGILGLRPALVILYGSQDDLRRQLTRAAIPIFEYRHGDLAHVTTTLRAIGQRVGHGPEAERLASSIEKRLSQTAAKVVGRPRPRVLLIFGREPGTLRNIHASGGYGFLHDMLTLTGGANVFEDVKRESQQVTSELILARRPEVILEVRATQRTTDRDATDKSAWQVLGAVPAVRSRRIMILAGEQFVVPVPRVADAVEQMARALHPQAFKD
jgi:iron complex transport system substrate-binding protein